jgi:hypothetical protein
MKIFAFVLTKPNFNIKASKSKSQRDKKNCGVANSDEINKGKLQPRRKIEQNPQKIR